MKKWIEDKAAEAEAAEEEKKILHFTALEESGVGISLNAVDKYEYGGPDPISLEYKVNNEEWTSWDLSEVQLQKNDVMYVRAVDQNFRFSKDYYSQYYRFSMSGGKVAAGGSVQYLLKKDGNIDSVPDCGFGYLFENCSNLVQAPELPATTLNYYCYNCMFNSCTSLTQAPKLPATTLADSCYDYMFENCSNLVQAPELPAMTLAKGCYDAMFYGCTSLTQAPELPATTLASGCYNQMFLKCTSLTQAPKLPATTLATHCYENMFFGCTNLVQAPELPATTLDEFCYQYMFDGCDKFSEVHMPASMDGVYSTSTHGNISKTVVYDL